LYLKSILLILFSQMMLFSDSNMFLSEGSKSVKISQKKVLDEKECLLIDVLYKNNPYNYQINLDYGECALFRGNIDAAMAAYDRAEIINEEDAAVHKRLGDLNAHIGNIEIANSEYDKADRFGKDIVERSLDSLYSSNSFSVLGRFSAGYDSNVEYNAELNDMQNYIDNTYSIRPASDTFIKEYLRIVHTYDSDAFNPFYYKSQLHAYNKNYFDLSEDDFSQMQLYTGPGWASKSFDLWIPLSYTYMATDYEEYAHIYSITPQFRKRFENKVLLKIEAEYSYEQYLQWSEGDKDIYSAGISLSKWFERNYIRIAYRYLQAEKESSDTPRIFIDKKVNEVEVNYVRAINKSFEAGIAYLYNKSLYSDIAKVGKEDKREDSLQKYSAYISYNITDKVGTVLQYDNYNNNTNYTPSSYKKEVLTVGVYFYY